MIAEFDEATRKWMTELASVAAASIVRQDTDAPIFHGAWDWHSSVHSHWTILRIARITGATSDLRVARNSLEDPAALAAELELLKRNPGFEMPYGRAWLLALVEEYEDSIAKLAPLAALGDFAFASMRAHYEQAPPTPLDLEYQNASWALARMLQYSRHRADADGEAWVRELIALRMRPVDAASLTFAGDRAEDSGFFSRAGNWIELRAMVDDKKDFAKSLTALKIKDADLTPVAALVTDHHLGMNPSRAWGFAAIARINGEERFHGAWRAHLDAARKTHEQRKGDYRAYDHWVPSFVTWAMTARIAPQLHK